MQAGHDGSVETERAVVSPGTRTARTVTDLAESKDLSKGIGAPFAHGSAESKHVTRRNIRLNVVHWGRYKAPSRAKLVNTKLDFFSNLLRRPVR